MNQDEIEDELDNWTQRTINLMNAYGWMLLFTNASLLIVTLIAIYKVIWVKRRFECFILMTLAFYFVSKAIFTGFSVQSQLFRENTPKSAMPISLSARFLYTMAHWFFAAQYLKTSMVFPKLLAQTRLEYVASENHSENRMSSQSQGIDYNKIQEELAKRGRGTEVDSIGILKSVEEAISEESKSIININKCIIVLHGFFIFITTLLYIGEYYSIFLP